LERTLKALLTAGRMSDEAEALVALARGLAAAVDQDPGNAALWREYRAAVTAVGEIGAGDDVDDDTADFLLSIRTPVRTSVGDVKKPGTGNARAGNSRRR
jgi:hypothetical protein